MKSSEKREKIFNVYAKNLKHVAQKYEIEIGVETDNGPQPITYPVYICPLCIRAFSIESLQQNQKNPLTLEDLPPKSVKGKAKILTCKECNNRSGHSLDVSIIESMDTESFLKRIPKSTLKKSKISINDGPKYKVITQITINRGFRFVLNKKNLAARNDLQSFKKNSTINFTFKIPTQKQVNTSLVRIGLLLAFYYLGNRVLFEGNYHKIRNHVNDPKNNKLPHHGIIVFRPEFQVQPGIHLIKKPTEYRSYLIVFDIVTDTISKTIAFPFPGPGKVGWKYYSNFNNMGKDTVLSLSDITSSEYIDNQGLVNAYDYIYKNG